MGRDRREKTKEDRESVIKMIVFEARGGDGRMISGDRDQPHKTSALRGCGGSPKSRCRKGDCVDFIV